MNLFACPPRSWRAAPSPFSPILSTIFPPFSVEKYKERERQRTEFPYRPR